MVLPIVGGVTYCWWCYLLLVVLPIIDGVTYCWWCYLLLIVLPIIDGVSYCWWCYLLLVVLPIVLLEDLPIVDNLGMFFNGVFLNVSLNSEKSETKIFVITGTGSLN